MHKSLATIDKIQFVDMEPFELNPLMDKCNIKVLYVGENRNGSYISKEVAENMSKTLRGTPIVGYFKEEKEDFRDHGKQVIMDDEGIHFECKTTPYGFVPTDAEVWFQQFDDYDEFGNCTKHEYLMTTGYLWTGQFPEIKNAVDEGRPQSMELDEKNLDGHWAEDYQKGVEFFIINDAIFSKLCILGNDVEPCFEGASVTPDAATTYTKVDDEFTKTLYTMMQELTYALKGGQTMTDEKIVEETMETEVTEDITPIEENTEVVEETNEVIEEVKESSVEESFTAKKDEDEEKEEKEEESENKEEKDSSEDEEEDEKKKKYSLLESDYEALTQKYADLEQRYAALEAERDSLAAFKLAEENAQKDALINKFYMLSDEDKAEVVNNKEKYSLDEIEKELGYLCFKKGVGLTSEEQEGPVTTFSFDGGKEEPAFLSALRKARDSRD